MELKFLYACKSCVFPWVLIVPLWNWNSGIGYSTAEPSAVLIVPLWNWNFALLLCSLSHLVVLIVPLWNWNLTYFATYCGAAPRFNRTFMELKFVGSDCLADSIPVLIVPLWNWNRGEPSPRTPWACFNRTFMELKSAHQEADCRRCRCFNRTFMELKWGIPGQSAGFYPF